MKQIPIPLIFKKMENKKHTKRTKIKKIRGNLFSELIFLVAPWMLEGGN